MRLLPSLLLVAASVLVFAVVSARAANPVEVCVGVVLPITGDRNLEALRVVDAIKMSAEDLTQKSFIPGTIFNVITDTALIDSAGYVQFGAERMYDQIMNRKCANGTSPIAVIGDFDDAVCHQMAPVAALLQVPLITPSAREPSFATDRDANQFVLTWRSGLKDEADAIKSFVISRGWTSVVLWHSDSTLGSAMSPAFTGSGLEVVDVPIPADDQGAEAQRALTRILSLRFRIIIVHAEATLARLMMNLSNKASMLDGDYIFIGSQIWTSGTDQAATVFNEEEKTYLQGVIGLSAPVTAASSATLYSRLQARNPLLYPPYFADAPINSRSTSYDALTAVAIAVRNLTAQGKAYTGLNLLKTLSSSAIDYSGINGNRITVNPTTAGRNPRFLVTNFQSGAFIQVGVYTQNGLVMDANTPIVWPGDDTNQYPSQEVPRVLSTVSASLPDVAVTLAILFGLGSALLHYLIYINTNHEVIKASSPVFCHIILGGGDIAYIMCGISAVGMDAVCSAVPSMIAITFSLVFGALVAKTYRIHKIFNSEGLKIKTPTNNLLFAFTGTLVGLDLIIVTVWMSTDKPSVQPVPMSGDVTASYQGCVMENGTAWSLAFFLPKGLIILFGAWLAYKVRDLNHNFNESRYVALALYNVITLAAILFGLISAFPDAVDAAYGLKAIGSAAVAFLTMLILFGPKFWDIYVTKDWIDYHSNSSYVSGVLVHKSSKNAGSYIVGGAAKDVGGAPTTMDGGYRKATATAGTTATTIGPKSNNSGQREGQQTQARRVIPIGAAGNAPRSFEKDAAMPVNGTRPLGGGNSGSGTGSSTGAQSYQTRPQQQPGAGAGVNTTAPARRRVFKSAGAPEQAQDGLNTPTSAARATVSRNANDAPAPGVGAGPSVTVNVNMPGAGVAASTNTPMSSSTQPGAFRGVAVASAAANNSGRRSAGASYVVTPAVPAPNAAAPSNVVSPKSSVGEAIPMLPLTINGAAVSSSNASPSATSSLASPVALPAPLSLGASAGVAPVSVPVPVSVQAPMPPGIVVVPIGMPPVTMAGGDLNTPTAAPNPSNGGVVV